MAMAMEYYQEISPNFWVSALTTEPLGRQELVVTICVRLGPELNRGLQDWEQVDQRFTAMLIVLHDRSRRI